MQKIIYLTISLLFLSPQLNAATEITPGVLYQPGSQLKVSSYGVELTVPAEWQAMLPQGAEALIMEPIGKTARMVVTAVPNSNSTSIRQLMNQTQPLDMMSQLQPTGQVTEQDGMFSQRYQIIGINPQNLVGSAYGRLGNNNTAIFVIMLEPQNQNMLPTLGKQFINSVSFSVPKSERQLQADANSNINWDQTLRGRTLRYERTSNGLTVEKQINLCSDGSFTYSDNDRYASSNVGGDFRGYSNSGDNGRWQIAGNQIILSWNDGSQSQYTLSQRYVREYGEWGIFVDDQRWFNNSNRVCN